MSSDERLRVGLVGAGPWAHMVHAPVFANHPRTTLAGVWARRPEAAQELAARHGSQSFEKLDGLLGVCDAVVFAVPPDVQADLALVAARAGKALLLEKPIALDLDAARRLTDAVDEAGVTTQLVLSWRYASAVRSFLEQVAAADPIGGRGSFISGAALGGPFVTPWRVQYGGLLDIGPHLIDLLDASLGTVVGVRAHGDTHRWTGLLLQHESGVVSEASMTARSNVQPSRGGVEVYAESGVIEVDASASVGDDTFTTVVDEFARTARGTAHPLDVHRGLHLQAVLHDVQQDLSG